MKKGKFLLILANIVVGIAIYFSLQKEKQKELSFDEVLISTLTNLKTLEIHPASSGKKIKIEKKSSDWIVTEPFIWASNKLALANFQTKFAHLSATRLYEINELRKKGEIIEDYGIRENSPTIKIAGINNQFEFKFGSLTRNENDIYSLVHLSNLNKKYIFKLDSEISTFYSTKAIDWTENSFIKTPLYAIDHLSITFENQEVKNTTSLTKQEEEWFFTEPFSGKADTERVLLLLNSLVSAKIINYDLNHADQNKSYNKWKAKLAITGFNQTEVFHFQETAQGKVVGHTDETKTKFILEESFLTQLNDWSSKLRSRILFEFSMDEIQVFEILQENKKVQLAKTVESKWEVGESNGSEMTYQDADEDEILNFFRKMNSATVDQFLSIKIAEDSSTNGATSSPIFTVNAISEDSRLNSYLFSRTTDEDQVWTVSDRDRALLCLVNQDFNRLLKVNLLDFRAKEVLPPKFNFSEIQFLNIESNESKIINMDTAPETYGVFSDFYAETFISDQYLDDGVWISGDWIPWKYKLSFANNENNTTKTSDFRLSERKGATTWYGGNPKNKLVFNLPINQIDNLEQLTKEIE